MEWLIKLLGGITNNSYRKIVDEHHQLQLHVEDSRKMTVSQLAASEYEKNQLREAKNTAEASAERRMEAVAVAGQELTNMEAKLRQADKEHAQKIGTLTVQISQLKAEHEQSLKKALADADEAVRMVKGCTKRVEDEAALAKSSFTVKLNNAENLLAQATRNVSEGLVRQAEQNAVIAASEQAVLLLREEKSNIAKLLEEREIELADYTTKTLDLYETIKTLESALSAAKAEVAKAKEEKKDLPNVEAIRTEAYEKAVAELKAIANKGNQTIDSVSRQRDAAVADRNASREALRIATQERDTAVRRLEETQGATSDVIKNLTRDRDTAYAQHEGLKQQLRIRGIDLTAIAPHVPVIPVSILDTGTPDNISLDAPLAVEDPVPAVKSDKSKRSHSKKPAGSAAVKIEKPIEDWIQNLLVESGAEVTAPVPTAKAKKAPAAKKPKSDNDTNGIEDAVKAPARSHKKKVN